MRPAGGGALRRGAAGRRAVTPRPDTGRSRAAGMGAWPGQATSLTAGTCPRAGSPPAGTTLMWAGTVLPPIGRSPPARGTGTPRPRTLRPRGARGTGILPRPEPPGSPTAGMWPRGCRAGGPPNGMFRRPFRRTAGAALPAPRPIGRSPRTGGTATPARAAVPPPRGAAAGVAVAAGSTAGKPLRPGHSQPPGRSQTGAPAWRAGNRPRLPRAGPKGRTSTMPPGHPVWPGRLMSRADGSAHREGAAGMRRPKGPAPRPSSLAPGPSSHPNARRGTPGA